MKTTLLCCCLALFAVNARVVSSPAKTIPSNTLHKLKFYNPPESANLPAELRAMTRRPNLRTSVADTFHLAWFDFDAGGVPDAQGWTSVDLTGQEGAYCHIADGTELNGGDSGRLVPIEGLQSMWCGAAPNPNDARLCQYAALPGYGNNWNQRFESIGFSYAGDVVLNYRMQYDTEPGYDEVRVEYFTKSGRWQTERQLSGIQCFLDTIIAPADSLGNQVKFRFGFTSDGAWSDEDGLWPTDGAMVIDSITVSDATGALDFQDFESETPGDLATSDGNWFATVPEAFGHFAALYPGTTVLQEDPCVTEIDHLWGWFVTPASENPYVCNGPLFFVNHPEQGAVPFGPNSEGFYMNNEIWSPKIPLTGAGDQMRFSFTMYGDQQLDFLVFHIWAVRTWVNGCPGPWKNDAFVDFIAQRAWVTRRLEVAQHIAFAGTDVQLSIGAIDLCNVWCGIFGSGTCHSHTPLVADVHLERIDSHGPRFNVRHLDLFQDNFAEDGTTTGHARADAANDIAPSASPTILPGDSVAITVFDPVGLATDPFTGVGAAVYTYVSILPQGQAGKSGMELEAPETRSIGTRYPVVDSLIHDGKSWYCIRMDSAITASGFALTDRYCVDLNDWVLSPGDTVRYVFCAQNTIGDRVYWSRRLDGQGDNFVTDDQWEALDSPCEFTILPAGGWKNGGDILYVDDTDDRGGPVQLFFDSAFRNLGILGQVDRYDVLGPTSNVNNSLASRVKNLAQIAGCYRKIIWSSGNLSGGLLGDGSGSPEKSDDYSLLFQFLDTKTDSPGVYISGDDIAQEWVGLTGAGAINLRSTFMNFNLVDGDHVDHGEGIAPCLKASGTVFTHLGGPDSLIALGGCPIINDFDVLQPVGLSQAEFNWPLSADAAILSQATPNSAGGTARVILSGFSYHYIRDKAAAFPLARFDHLLDILRWLGNNVPDPVGIEPTSLATNYLDNAYPNPFNPTTTIRYGVREKGHVSLRIYNVAGQLVRTLVNEVKTPRPEGFAITWDGQSNRGNAVASGVYFYKLITKGFAQTKKMVLLK